MNKNKNTIWSHHSSIRTSVVAIELLFSEMDQTDGTKSLQVSYALSN